MNRTTEYFNSVYDATFRELMRCCLLKVPVEDAGDLLHRDMETFRRIRPRDPQCVQQGTAVEEGTDESGSERDEDPAVRLVSAVQEREERDTQEKSIKPVAAEDTEQEKEQGEPREEKTGERFP